MKTNPLGRRALMSVALFLVATAFGCSRDDATKSAGTATSQKPEVPKIIKLAFVTNNPSQFWKIAEAGIRRYEKEGKVQVDLKMPNGTPEDQNTLLQNLANQSYDAIAVSVVAPADQVRVLNEVAKKTTLLTHDSDAEKSERLLYIGTNNYEAGKALGVRIVQLLPEGGKIAVFVGTFAADNATQRLQGIEDAVKDHKIEIVDKREDNTDRAKARSNVEDIINAHKDLSLVVGLWNYNGPAIAAAIDGLGKSGQVLAAVFDEDEETLAAIAKGTIQATVVQKPFEFGYQASKWMHELVTRPEETKKKLPPGKIIDTGVEVIDKDNVAGFTTTLEEMKKSVP
ncbi:MAG: hypothetical protein RJA70_3295 [Pseudomonadota bacterium]|jgi:ribose transport system substrate-binding protein